MQPSRLFLAAFFVLLFFASFSPANNRSTIELHFLGVGYGDAILVKLPLGKTMLIDTGPDEYSKKVCEYLNRSNTRRLDVMVLTHCHPDHIGGAPKIIEAIEVGEIWTNQGISSNVSFQPVYDSIRKRRIPTVLVKQKKENTNSIGKREYRREIGHVSIYCIGPKRIVQDSNDNSIVLKMKYRNNTFLLAGDTTPRIMRELYNTEKQGLRCDVFEIPHHGLAAYDRFIETLHAKIAVLSVGKNPFGAPDPEVLEIYRRYGCRITRTDVSGNIVVKSDGKRIWLETQK